MEIYLAEQALVFAEALLVGAVFGLLYDVFRITRIAFSTSPGVVFVEDIVFFTVCAIVTFFFGLTVIDGMLRVFLIFGELSGAIVYYFTLGRLVMSISKKIITVVKAIINFMIKWIFRPIWNVFYSIVALIVRPFVFFKKIFKKKLQKAKFHLKIKRKVLYNQLSAHIPNKKNKKPKVRKNEKTKKHGKKTR